MTVKLKENDGSKNGPSTFHIGLEIFSPFILAGLGMVLAGLLLDTVQHWNVFRDCPELFILVPALLGLKGNLEMTLASRLSTAANLGQLDQTKEAWNMAVSNLALVQIQGIVVGLLASCSAMIMGWGPTLKFELEQALLLATSSVVTASLASLTLGIVMILVVIESRRYRINPDNVATPVAASLGDLTTLAILSYSANILHTLNDSIDKLSFWSFLPSNLSLVVSSTILIIYFAAISPVCIKLAKKSDQTRDILMTGWTPVLSAMAMVISSLGGKILNHTVVSFPDVAAFQPVINGVAGNLVSVQASRISTSLHQNNAKPEVELKISRLLLSMVVPGHLIFNAAIAFSDEKLSGVNSSLPFLILYLSAAVLQVEILLQVASYLVHWLWQRGIDPDNAAIPYLTSLGDLLGGALLAAAFHVYYSNFSFTLN